MTGLASKSFDNPDETRTPDKTAVHVVRLTDEVQAARMTLQPGWSWAECIKPVVGGDHCQARHVGVVLSGRMHVDHTDGSEAEVGAGEAYFIAPGHDAHVVGDEPFSAYEFDAQTTCATCPGAMK
jgi:mannose-6-phosphate isomerase-like protein (cupin superfamily)